MEEADEESCMSHKKSMQERQFINREKQGRYYQETSCDKDTISESRIRKSSYSPSPMINEKRPGLREGNSSSRRRDDKENES